MLGIFSKKKFSYFSAEQQAAIVAAIKEAEHRTSGEIRIYVEGRCYLVNPVHRAMEIFAELQMDKTEERNAVLVYIAMKDRQLAIYGDAGIHDKVGTAFWNNEVQSMLAHFNKKDYVQGIVKIIHDIGEALVTHFPYNANTDKNELPDDIVFGK
ncbi:MAG: TPM domain-containing protein [Sediminibacterium sp.]|nr:TPM domain-containing protein [Sediminibacterium sp.]